MKAEKKFELPKDIKSVGVILRPQSPELKDAYKKIKDLLNSVDIKPILEKNSANMIDMEGLDFDDICKKVDFLICVGGDGTLLSTVRRSFKYELPLLGINLGTLGFLTDLSMEQLPKFLDDLVEQKYKISQRMLFEGSINKKKFIAFNDIVISRKYVSSMIKIRGEIDEKPFNTYYGDGVMVSTPTGSTAYNLSVGGPIVHPSTDAFIINPISPHSLTQRPLVMPSGFEIEFKVLDNQGAVVIVDGQDIFEVGENESIKIKIANKKVKMLHRVQRNYFEVLSEKLRWGNKV